jgi:hypothetical protein
VWHRAPAPCANLKDAESAVASPCHIPCASGQYAEGHEGGKRTVA